jgi:hypothetical protein
MTTTSLTNVTLLGILIALAALAILISAAIATRRRSRDRSTQLQQRFGPEYEHALEEYGSLSRAEHELAARERRVRRLKLSELNEVQRARLASRWTQIQGQFVDDPVRAVGTANTLVTDVMTARGYPTEDFDQRVADLSVDHAAVIQHYRAARALSAMVAANRDNTEDLRQAMVHYRVLFADLLEEKVKPSHRSRLAHA